MAQSFTFIGTITAIGQTTSREGNGKTYYSRTIRLVEDPMEEWPKKAEFAFQGDKCQLLDLYKEGQEAEIKFNIRGVEYLKNGEQKFFQTLEAWSIQKVGASTSAPTTPTQTIVTHQRPAPTPPAQKQNVPQFEAGTEDDLPF